MKNKDEIEKKVNEIVKSFPLHHNTKINSNKKISEIINLFNSLLSERLKAKLLDQFPNILFDEITSNSTLKDIYQIIFNYENKNLTNKNKINLPLGNNFNSISENPNNLLFDDLFFENLPLIGIDIESRDSFPNDIFSSKCLSERKRLFTENEIIYSLTKSDPEITLIGIYSAKEAIKKAINKFLNMEYINIEINHSKNGKPYAKIKNSFFNNRIKISISHAKDYAVALSIFQ